MSQREWPQEAAIISRTEQREVGVLEFGNLKEWSQEDKTQTSDEGLALVSLRGHDKADWESENQNQNQNPSKPKLQLEPTNCPLQGKNCSWCWQTREKIGTSKILFLFQSFLLMPLTGKRKMWFAESPVSAPESQAEKGEWSWETQVFSQTAQSAQLGSSEECDQR